MKFIISTSVFFLSTMLISAEEAQKICFVNFEAALSLEVKSRKALEALDAAEKAILQDEQKTRDTIQKKMLALRAMSEKARQDEEMKLSKEIEAAEQKFTKARMDQTEKRQEITKQLEDENRLLLNNIAKNKKCGVVLNAAALVYVSDEIKKNDLTQELGASHNKAYPVKPDAKTPTKSSSSKPPLKAPAKK